MFVYSLPQSLFTKQCIDLSRIPLQWANIKKWGRGLGAQFHTNHCILSIRASTWCLCLQECKKGLLLSSDSWLVLHCHVFVWLSPPSRPVRSRAKTSRDVQQWVSWTSFWLKELEVWFAHWLIFACFNYSNWLLWFKAALTRVRTNFCTDKN